MLQRFANGLYFLAIYDAGTPVASTWAVCDGLRFINEMGIGYETGRSGLWLRDMCVAPGRRGQRLFSHTMDALAAQGPRLQTFFSDMDRGNNASLKAHARYGFEPIGRLSGVHFWGRFMLRDRRDCPLAPACEFAPGRSLLRRGPDFADFVRTRLA